MKLVLLVVSLALSLVAQSVKPQLKQGIWLGNWPVVKNVAAKKQLNDYKLKLLEKIQKSTSGRYISSGYVVDHRVIWVGNSAHVLVTLRGGVNTKPVFLHRFRLSSDCDKATGKVTENILKIVKPENVQCIQGGGAPICPA